MWVNIKYESRLNWFWYLQRARIPPHGEKWDIRASETPRYLSGASHSELLGTMGKTLADWSLQMKLNITWGTRHHWNSSSKDGLYDEFILLPQRLRNSLRSDGIEFIPRHEKNKAEGPDQKRGADHTSVVLRKMNHVSCWRWRVSKT